MKTRRITTKLSETEQVAVALYREGTSYDEICSNLGLGYRAAVGAVTRARNKLKRQGINIPNIKSKPLHRECKNHIWQPEYLRGITEFCIACKDVAGIHNNGYYCTKDGASKPWDTPGCTTWVEGST